MAPDGRHDGTTAEADNMLRQLTEGISDLGPGELKDVLHRQLAAGVVGVDPFERTPPPSRRRPRRLNVVTYRVRIDLEETKPPLWP